jgi:hypothetical protein
LTTATSHRSHFHGSCSTSCRVPTLLHALLDQLLLSSNSGFVWVLVAAAAVRLPPLREEGRAFLLGLVAAHLLALTIIFTFSRWDPYMDHVKSAIDRLVFQVLPMGLLFVGTSVRIDHIRQIRALQRRES